MNKPNAAPRWTADSVTPDMAAELDGLADVIAQHLQDGGIAAVVTWHEGEIQRAQVETSADVLRLVVSGVWGKGDSNIRLAALAYIAGMDWTRGRSLEEVAETIGCTKQAISKESNRWADRLKLRAIEMKSEAARDSYSRKRRAASSK